MTVTYDADDTFLGERMTRFRDLLRAWGGLGGVASAARQRRIGLDLRAAAALADEARLQGLYGFVEGEFGRTVWAATEAGRGLLAASPLKPIDRARAAAIIEALLSRCEAANACGDLPFAVDRVWLFGSYVHGKERVNDVDVVVETSKTERWSSEGERYIEMAFEMGGRSAVTSHICWEINAMDYIKRRLVYGKRIHPRLAPNDVGTLKNLACECQLVFDAARGGRVSDPVLPRHPESQGRSASVRDKLSMPELDRLGSLLPVALDVAEVDSWRAEEIDPVAAALRVRPPMWALSALPEIGASSPSIAPSSLKRWTGSLGELDGRRRGVLLLLPAARGGGEDKWGGLLVERAIWPSAGGFDYAIDLPDADWSANLDIEDLCAFASRLVCAIGADFEKMARRAGAEGRPCDVRVTLRGCARPVAVFARAWVTSALASSDRRWLSDRAQEVVRTVAVTRDATCDVKRVRTPIASVAAGLERLRQAHPAPPSAPARHGRAPRPRAGEDGTGGADMARSGPPFNAQIL